MHAASIFTGYLLPISMLKVNNLASFKYNGIVLVRFNQGIDISQLFEQRKFNIKNYEQRSRMTGNWLMRITENSKEYRNS